MSRLHRQLCGFLIGVAACGADQAPSGISDAGGRDSGVGPFSDAGLRLDAGGADAGTSSPPVPSLGAQIDRMGRPATNNLLIAPIFDEPIKGQAKDAYNKAGRGAFMLSKAPIAESLAVYDGLDGLCGNQFLAGVDPVAGRYDALATLLADDRLHLNADSVECLQYLAVELTQSGVGPNFATDCGGRAPDYDVIECLYSTLIIGSWTGVSDGVDRDSVAPSPSSFPFLAPP